jgi:hypothetical protein
MAITSNDVTSFLDLLDTDRKATARLRQMILPGEPLQRIEANLAELTEAQKRTETSLAKLAEAQQRTEAHVARLDTAMAKLAEAQERTEAHVARLDTAMAKLAEAQERSETVILVLSGEISKTRDLVGQIRGTELERHSHHRLPSFLGRRLGRTRALLPYEVLDELEARLSTTAMDDILLADLLVRGQYPRGQAESSEVWLVTEVSAVIDRSDIERAGRRAALLRKAGLTAIPAVAGDKITRGAKEALTDVGAVLVLGGQVENWDDALGRHAGGSGD